jgi:hypothetical protein
MATTNFTPGHNRTRFGAMDKRLAPTEWPTTHDIAWAAGIYEGEGSCFPNSNTISLVVPQKDTWILERFRALFGGSIGLNRTTGVYRWTVSGARARGLAMTIYGLLSPRRQQQIRKAYSLD